MPRISLIICTYNRADILPRCLVAAMAQTLPAHEYEVIVVDNASSDHTRAIVEHLPGVRYLFCGVRGLSAARNSGAFAARSDLIAFIDDDAIADKHLVSELLQTFDAHPRVACVGGRIRLSMPSSLPKWFCQEFAGYYSEYNPAGDEPRRTTEMWEYPFGANVAFRRSVLDQVGGFSEKLGRIGRDQSGGEELDLECRIATQGHEIWYNPRAIVDHVIMPQRLRWSHISNSAKAAGRNWAYYEVELWKNPAHLAADIRMLAGALRRTANRENFYFAYSQSIFYRAKILRKLRYRFRMRP